MLTDGFHSIPPGKVAAIVTHLSMSRPKVPPTMPDLPLRHLPRPEVGWYRDLFTRVGALDWLWFSRLRLEPTALEAILCDPLVEVHALELDGRAEGLLELDFRDPAAPELAFFGLTPEVQGRGYGRQMMQAALALAFARDIPQLTIHTCTFDSPVALPFYLRSGFVPVSREVEVVDDPRLTGDIPRDAARQIPVITG